ncbi:MAG: polyprenyl diphosphate synthase [Betaproteobacteria bacterium]|nr:polyprenyl diphosphate synthase [Pseudomonadota bacterium]
MPEFISSTQDVPPTGGRPRHVAIIMDGNGRWAKKRHLPRIAGHRRGLESLRAVTSACIERGISHLTVFAFSSENWRRPAEEVFVLQQLFAMALEQEVERLHRNGIRLKVIGELSAFNPRIVELVASAEALTKHNDRLTLTIAANYGGRKDLLQAVEKMVTATPKPANGYCEADLARHLALSYAPEPDLFIRTGGEQRISNFLLWQLAYTELYFTNTLWPDFEEEALDLALNWYGDRERRFGRTSEQLEGQGSAADGLTLPLRSA